MSKADDSAVLVIGYPYNGRYRWVVPGMDMTKEVPHKPEHVDPEQQVIDLVFAMAGSLASIEAYLKSINEKLGSRNES